MTALRSFGLLILALTATTFAMAGCGGGGGRQPTGPTGTVSGTVTFQGQPVTEGTVRLYNPSTAEESTGPLDSAGKFQLSQPVPVGTYKVTVLPPKEPDPQIGVPYQPKEHKNIPQKYRSELTSDLTTDVKEGPNTVTVDLQP